jgi:hypothetical protein
MNNTNNRRIREYSLNSVARKGAQGNVRLALGIPGSAVHLWDQGKGKGWEAIPADIYKHIQSSWRRVG